MIIVTRWLDINTPVTIYSQALLRDSWQQSAHTSTDRTTSQDLVKLQVLRFQPQAPDSGAGRWGSGIWIFNVCPSDYKAGRPWNSPREMAFLLFLITSTSCSFWEPVPTVYIGNCGFLVVKGHTVHPGRGPFALRPLRMKSGSSSPSESSRRAL